jgi:hypothetical protein
MKKYDKSIFTYGAEIEWGDIPRNKVIPDNLGSWEYCECDIINLNGRYRGLACDPDGIDPPVGGEINTKPTQTWPEQLDRIMEIKNLFERPTAGTVNHGHLHIRVPGLRDDIEALKRLTKYVVDNQDLCIEKCYQFKESDLMKGDKAKTYLKWDGGRPMPDWMGENIDVFAENFEDFIRIQQCGKDGKSRGRPFRYAINTYCLKHTDTIEFRLFRSSINEREIHDSLMFVENFIDAALNDGPSVEEILKQHNYLFPRFIYDPEMSRAWKETKHSSDISKKVRTLYEVS